jgi:hypothetical protein
MDVRASHLAALPMMPVRPDRIVALKIASALPIAIYHRSSPDNIVQAGDPSPQIFTSS